MLRCSLPSHKGRMPSLPSIESLVIVAAVAIIAITFHEAAHGYVAWKLGDPTAHQQGRVSFNPIRHIDPFGTVVLPLILFIASGWILGWAKPVPVNPSRLNSPRRDMVFVAAAGPGINLTLALVSGRILSAIGGRAAEPEFLREVAELLDLLQCADRRVQPDPHPAARWRTNRRGRAARLARLSARAPRALRHVDRHRHSTHRAARYVSARQRDQPLQHAHSARTQRDHQRHREFVGMGGAT